MIIGVLKYIKKNIDYLKVFKHKINLKQDFDFTDYPKKKKAYKKSK